MDGSGRPFGVLEWVVETGFGALLEAVDEWTQLLGRGVGAFQECVSVEGVDNRFGRMSAPPLAAHCTSLTQTLSFSPGCLTQLLVFPPRCLIDVDFFVHTMFLDMCKLRGWG